MKSPQALASLVVAASGQSWIWTVENSSSQSASVISHFTVTASLTKTVSPWSGFLTLMSSAVHAMAEADEPAAQVAVIACASHDESPSNSQLVDAAAAARSPSGSARRYSSEKVELPPHSSQANIPSSSAPPPTYIRSCHASSSDEYQR